MQKKIYIIILILVSINIKGFSQIDPLRQKLDSIFQYVDKTQIPTGYLNEYGPEVVYKKWLNVVLSDSNLILDMNTYNYLTKNS